MPEFTDVKEKLCDETLYSILAPSVFDPTPERLLCRVEKYQKDDKTNVYAYLADNVYKGIVVFKIEDNTATILDVAVKYEYQRNGIGSSLIGYVFEQFNINKIIAETDDDAIGFYKNCGFIIADTVMRSNAKRYVCVCERVAYHYDLLVKENNDPVHDPKPLREYMDKWDGQNFIDKMELETQKSVLEIGVGTGRLAVRVAPLCGQFYGIDISPNTIKRAKENLSAQTNVNLYCGDFLTFKFSQYFDVVYSSLTFMHIEEKQNAVNRVASLLRSSGKFVLSIDKNQDVFIDTGTRKITVFPDTPAEMESYIANSGLLLIEHYETEFAHIFVAKK